MKCCLKMGGAWGGVNLLGELLVTENGEAIADVMAEIRDVLAGIKDSMDKQNKILFKVSQTLTK